MGKTAIFCLLAFLALALPGCTEAIQGETTATVHLLVENSGGIIVDRQAGVEKGANAFEVMKDELFITYQESEFGAFIEAIEGEFPGEGNYWALYVDGEMSATGISGITINEDTEIKWKIESIESFGG